MLINCPRCGFSQPKDQYCASCGVDMDKFIPRKVNIIEKFFKSTLVQVALVISLTLTASYFAFQSKTEETMQSSRRKQVISAMSTSRSGAMGSTLANSESLEGTSKNVNNSGSTESEVNIQLEAKTEEQRDLLAGDETIASGSADGVNNNSAKLGSVAVKYSFYEIDRELLAYWVQINNTGDAGESVRGLQTGLISTEILHKQIQHQALKTETKKIGLIDSEIFIAGVKGNNRDDFIGLESQIKLNELNYTQLKGSLVITRQNLQGIDSITVPIVITKQYAYFVHWKESLMGFDLGFTSPPFQVLRSRNLQSGKTELVVIIEPFF